jgi:apolipoprotein D and lipocalin family protein
MKQRNSTDARHRNCTPWSILRLGILALSAAILLNGCSTSAPEGLTAVTPFDLNRYIGKWYEIARLDHAFERGMTDVSATYTIKPDGSVEVLNRGFHTQRGHWKSATGRALFTGPTDRGSLKVSFFGPFYGGYHVIALDQAAYRWALIAGSDRDYLWILARDKQISEQVKNELLAKAHELGFATNKLIWVEHLRTDN